MNRSILLLAACASFVQATAQNSCGEALAIGLGTYVVDTIDGPTAPPLACANGGIAVSASEWYSFTPLNDTSVVLSTAPGPDVDTRFHVFTGTCSGLTCWAGDDDDGPGLASLDTFFVFTGVTYLIAFDDRYDAFGFPFTLSECAPPDTTPPVVPDAIIDFTAVSVPVNGDVQCITDMDHDLLDDPVGTTATLVSIAHQQAGGGFVTTNTATPTATYPASWSICAGDLNGDTWNDFLYGAGQGASLMLTAGNNSAYTEQHSMVYVFSQRTNMVDINNDGNLDAFISHDTQPNVYFLGDGAGNFNFFQGGIGSQGGNYASLWTDYDNDGDLDMFITRCSGNAWDGLMRNNGDGTFTDIAQQLGLQDGHQAWSTAIGDYDNDGDMDMMIGRNGAPTHKLMENNGDGTFTNITIGSGFDLGIGNGRDWVTHDFNNDGWLDIFGNNALMINNGDMTFTSDVVPCQPGPIGDLNNDGFLDIMNGSTAFMNAGNDSTNYVRIATEGVVSNYNGIGARITLTTASGTQIREIRSGDGFEYMSTMTAHFGLGADAEVEQIVIRWPSGIVDVLTAPEINTTLHVVEGLHTSLSEQSVHHDLMLFPNPAVDAMMANATGLAPNAPFRILDATGKLVLTGTLRNGQLDVAGLNAGVYLLALTTPEGSLQQRFTKY